MAFHKSEICNPQSEIRSPSPSNGFPWSEYGAGEALSPNFKKLPQVDVDMVSGHILCSAELPHTAELA